mmetsp:Transcript_49178/g.123636  ORF Transcript_49178/g.123636 Transcript_49178/m.123636 type:complete len:281 (-) Transcript_49178:1621-2463(-)
MIERIGSGNLTILQEEAIQTVDAALVQHLVDELADNELHREHVGAFVAQRTLNVRTLLSGARDRRARDRFHVEFASWERYIEGDTGGEHQLLNDQLAHCAQNELAELGDLADLLATGLDDHLKVNMWVFREEHRPALLSIGRTVQVHLSGQLDEPHSDRQSDGAGFGARPVDVDLCGDVGTGTPSVLEIDLRDDFVWLTDAGANGMHLDKALTEDDTIEVNRSQEVGQCQCSDLLGDGGGNGIAKNVRVLHVVEDAFQERICKEGIVRLRGWHSRYTHLG